ncbi:MAG: RidA family protein [Betaproteobacteria bacterium]|nr:RidA family protein [Betaproteobacteria bacterium]
MTDTPKGEIRLINPEGLADLGTFSHVAETRGGRTLYVSGQLGWDASMRLVAPNDLAAQTQKAFENLGIALAGAGATFGNVVKFTIFVVDMKPEDRIVVSDIRRKFVDTARPPASTLIGVSSLIVEGARIEIEAVALVP